MPGPKRAVHEHTEDWSQLRLLLKWPEQVAYELVRDVVVFGDTAAQRALHTGENERTIARKADRFDEQGMLGLFLAPRREPVEDRRSLTPPTNLNLSDSVG